MWFGKSPSVAVLGPPVRKYLQYFSNICSKNVKYVLELQNLTFKLCITLPRRLIHLSLYNKIKKNTTTPSHTNTKIHKTHISI